MIRCSIKYISSLLLILSFGFSADDAIKVGDKASPIILFKLDQNKYFRSKDFLGEKNQVFSFFATWCLPCAKEIPKLHELDEKFGDEYQFILVDVNEKKDKVAKHVKNKKYTLQVILDRYGKVFEAFGGTALPLTVVINKKGVITYHHTGYEPGAELKLEKHLKTL